MGILSLALAASSNRRFSSSSRFCLSLTSSAYLWKTWPSMSTAEALLVALLEVLEWRNYRLKRSSSKLLRSLSVTIGLNIWGLWDIIGMSVNLIWSPRNVSCDVDMWCSWLDTLTNISFSQTLTVSSRVTFWIAKSALVKLHTSCTLDNSTCKSTEPCSASFCSVWEASMGLGTWFLGRKNDGSGFPAGRMGRNFRFVHGRGASQRDRKFA